MKRFLTQCGFFARAQQGVAMVEFAIALPFLAFLLMGSLEMTRYILIAQKVEKVSVTISDLVSQGNTVSSTDLTNIIQAAAQVMQPYTFGTNGYVIISSVTQTGTPSSSNKPKVNWQYSGGGTWVKSSLIGVTGGNATMPTGFTMVDKENVIVTEVFYNYQPLFSGGYFTGQSIYKVALFKPRLGALTTLSAAPSWFAGAVV
jgi:Flp pilus assembly protein TadG